MLAASFISDLLSPLTSVEETVLEGLHSIGLGWGLAIVGLTLLVRALTLPLVRRQFRGQRELRRHAPELKQLRERFKDDRERLQKETLAYYKQHSINPLGSMAPLLIQVPIFISLYALLRGDASSGMFGDAGFLFIPSLTEKAHGAVLVAMITLYLCTQVASSAIATRSLGGRQRGMMMTLPLLFATIIARFPAGLAIYSVTTALWTLGQQIVFWRASPAEPLPATGLAGAGASGNGSAPAEPAEEAPTAEPAARPTHSRSKKKRRPRSRR